VILTEDGKCPEGEDHEIRVQSRENMYNGRYRYMGLWNGQAIDSLLLAYLQISKINGRIPICLCPSNLSETHDNNFKCFLSCPLTEFFIGIGGCQESSDSGGLKSHY
jgi:hypothetical protein